MKAGRRAIQRVMPRVYFWGGVVQLAFGVLVLAAVLLTRSPLTPYWFFHIPIGGGLIWLSRSRLIRGE